MLTLRPGTVDVLHGSIQPIRQQAGECQLLDNSSWKRRKPWGRGPCRPLWRDATDLREYDQALLRELDLEEPRNPSGALLPVDERWALVWEEVEEDAETARRVRTDPEDWVPPSVDRLLAGRSWSELWRRLARPPGSG